MTKAAVATHVQTGLAVGIRPGARAARHEARHGPIKPKQMARRVADAGWMQE